MTEPATDEITVTFDVDESLPYDWTGVHTFDDTVRFNEAGVDVDLSIKKIGGSEDAFRYDAGNDRIKLRSSIDFKNNETFSWDTLEVGESQKVFMNLGTTGIFSLGALTSSGYNDMRLRLGSGDEEVILRQSDGYTFNFGFNDRDFTVRKNVAGSAIAYNSGADLLTLGGDRVRLSPQTSGDAPVRLEMSEAFDSGTARITIQAPVDLTAGTGSYTLTLPPNDGDASQVLSTDGAGVTSWVAPSGVSTINSPTYTPITGNTTATFGSAYLCKTNGGGFTLTLPIPSGNDGQSVRIKKSDIGNLGNTLTIDGNGKDIMGDPSDMLIVPDNIETILVWDNTDDTWRL